MLYSNVPGNNRDVLKYHSLLSPEERPAQSGISLPNQQSPVLRNWHCSIPDCHERVVEVQDIALLLSTEAREKAVERCLETVFAEVTYDMVP